LPDDTQNDERRRARRAGLVRALDASIYGFDQEARANRSRATRRATRLTGLDWTFSTLLIMEGMLENGPSRLTELAELAGTTPPTVTKLIKDLEAKGFVNRTADQQDGRASIVSLTDEGRQVAEAIVGKRFDALQQVLTAWADEDLERVTVLLEQLRADMRRLS
jgi:DNA-binding MarR family transcriptional regulator